MLHHWDIRGHGRMGQSIIRRIHRVRLAESAREAARRRKPDGPSLRLLEVAEQHPGVILVKVRTRRRGRRGGLGGSSLRISQGRLVVVAHTEAGESISAGLLSPTVLRQPRDPVLPSSGSGADMPYHLHVPLPLLDPTPGLLRNPPGLGVGEATTARPLQPFRRPGILDRLKG